MCSVLAMFAFSFKSMMDSQVSISCGHFLARISAIQYRQAHAFRRMQDAVVPGFTSSIEQLVQTVHPSLCSCQKKLLPHVKQSWTRPCLPHSPALYTFEYTIECRRSFGHPKRRTSTWNLRAAYVSPAVCKLHAEHGFWIDSSLRLSLSSKLDCRCFPF